MIIADSLTWFDVEGAELDARTLYDVLALRAAVFVVEQDCPYQDPDGRDLVEGTRHLVGRVDGEIVAYARILAPGESHPTPRIGRVIVAPPARGGQLGRALMLRALDVCAEHWPGQAVELGGQAHLTGFYQSLGFWAVGAPYVEDGIPHQWMRR
ncbi:MAG TPA: GNAT family N-acetyltransferase [Propionicimonas sp.]|nr:GNAT family N-acetyltransferase [Propionicimonas sp.]